jgi:hypothetical protein
VKNEQKKIFFRSFFPFTLLEKNPETQTKNLEIETKKNKIFCLDFRDFCLG